MSATKPCQLTPLDAYLQQPTSSDAFREAWKAVDRVNLRRAGPRCPKMEARVYAKIFVSEPGEFCCDSLVAELLRWAEVADPRSLDSIVLCAAKPDRVDAMLGMWRQLLRLQGAGSVQQLGVAGLNHAQTVELREASGSALLQAKLLNEVRRDLDAEEMAEMQRDEGLFVTHQSESERAVLRALQVPGAPAVLLQGTVLLPQTMVLSKREYLVPVR